MKGFKAFTKDLKCRNMQYERGKEYVFDGKPIPCRQGFHFCKTVADCYNFYEMTEDTRIFRVEAIGDIKTDDEVKYCTNRIKIISEVKNPRLKSNLSDSSSGYCNSGYMNSGDRNSGNYNSGYRNSGDWNSCDYNSGDWNSGNYNSGNWNIGDYNSGDRNSGNYNSGNYNSGNWNSGYRNSGYMNSGDWNSGNWNSGILCTNKKPKIKIFDIETDWTMDDWYNSEAHNIMSKCPYTHSCLIYESDMTDEEKENHPEYKTIGGYIKTFIITAKEKQAWWDGLDDADKKAVKSLPNFDADKFYQCTEIRV